MAQSDSRFNYHNFSAQPQWLIRQAIQQLEQQSNYGQLSTARLNQFYYNVNVEESSRLQDFTMFLPYPETWSLLTKDRKVNITRKAARDFLSTYKKLPAEVLFAMDDWINDIQICSIN